MVDSISLLTLGIRLTLGATALCMLILAVIVIRQRRGTAPNRFLAWTCIILALLGVLASLIFSDKREDLRYENQVRSDIATAYSSQVQVNSVDRSTSAISFYVMLPEKNGNLPVMEDCNGTVMQPPGKMWDVDIMSLTPNCQKALTAAS